MVMNSFRNGGWEAEECVSDNPFKQGEAFEMFTVINLKESGTCFENETQHTPKRELGPCPQHGLCCFWFIRVYVIVKSVHIQAPYTTGKVSTLNISKDVL